VTHLIDASGLRIFVVDLLKPPEDASWRCISMMPLEDAYWWNWRMHLDVAYR
jgi:hypothetical protein